MAISALKEAGGGLESLKTQGVAIAQQACALSAILLFFCLISCNSNDPADPNLGSAPVVVSVSVDTAMTAYTTYSTESRAGESHVLRLQVQAIADDDHRILASDSRVIRPGQPLSAEFNFTLPSGKHHLLAWADYVDDTTSPTDLYYHTSDLTDISFVGKYMGDTDWRNAYSGHTPIDFKVYKGDTTTVIHSDVSVRSIMGKIRFISTDYNEWLDKAQPLRVLVSYTGFLPNHYSVLRGVPFDSTTGISFITAMRDGNTEGDGSVVMAEDLVMVNGDESAVQVAIGLYDDDGKLVSSSGTLTVPLRRGGITTVTGHFLTKTASAGGIGIDPSFNGDFNIFF